MHSTRSRLGKLSSIRKASLVALAAALAAFTAGCGDDGITGAPACNGSQASLTGTVGGTTVDVQDSFKGGLTQGDKSSLRITFDKGGELDIDWSGTIPDGQTQFIDALTAFPGVTGGAVCAGGELQLNGGVATFHLTDLTACSSGSSESGEIFGCVDVGTGSSSSN